MTGSEPGSEIYVGCSNGELIRFALQADDPNVVGEPLQLEVVSFTVMLAGFL
jgi:hypothetical protein